MIKRHYKVIGKSLRSKDNVCMNEYVTKKFIDSHGDKFIIEYIEINKKRLAEHIDDLICKEFINE